MATETWEYRYSIAAPSSKIYAHLTDPHHYIGLSPLITKVYDVVRLPDGIQYTTIERFKFLGFIPYDNHIQVVTTFTHLDHEMLSQVKSPFQVNMRFLFQLSNEDDTTIIQEVVTAQSPRIVHGFVVSQAKAVQQARAQNLKNRMERDQTMSVQQQSAF